ncbi:MBL fold metallo-hydrolase [Patescibacteria group bacterium]|nr:MBL fold metallo-hydrolase [Patescibacteria group bacterium]MBU4082449.1 MBL fold metallo-hydrolase [Patescibacteria group bacterium]MCG2808825.1 MBL fold metallo-hydrolase [Candidatus Portnoybacteria bacterium]
MIFIIKYRKFAYSFLGILLVGTIFVWSAVFSLTADDILEVHFFDVGQGDSIFIETPFQKQVLIDGGPDKTVLEKLNQTMPFYDRKIDLLILTHPDADHITGLVDVLEYYQVGHILTSGFETDTAVYKKWRELIDEKNIPLTIAQAGQKIILSEGIVLEILWPEQPLVDAKSVNNASVVSRLIYRQTEFLLTGDIEKKIENILIERNTNLESDILKVPHHGSKTSSSYNFIKAVNPKISVISVGENNRYKHPNQEVLDILKNAFISRTDKNGDITILTNGELFEVKTER